MSCIHFYSTRPARGSRKRIMMNSLLSCTHRHWRPQLWWDKLLLQCTSLLLAYLQLCNRHCHRNCHHRLLCFCSGRGCGALQLSLLARITYPEARRIGAVSTSSAEIAYWAFLGRSFTGRSSAEVAFIVLLSSVCVAVCCCFHSFRFRCSFVRCCLLFSSSALLFAVFVVFSSSACCLRRRQKFQKFHCCCFVRSVGLFDVVRSVSRSLCCSCTVLHLLLLHYGCAVACKYVNRFQDAKGH